MLNGYKLLLRTIALLDVLFFVATCCVVGPLEYYSCGYKSRPIPFALLGINSTAFDDVEFYKGSYDYVRGLLYIDGNRGVGYSFMFMAFMAFGTAYFILEVWLFAVLFKGSMKEKRVTGCKRWLGFRLFLFVASTAFVLIDLVQLRYTCTDIAIFPLGTFRAVSFFAVMFCYLKIVKQEKKMRAKMFEEDSVETEKASS